MNQITVMAIVAMMASLWGNSNAGYTWVYSNKGVENLNKDCWNKGECGWNGPNGRNGQGPCEFCGPEGYCCRKEPYWDKTNGCDGTIGGERGHQCVAKHDCTLVNIGSSTGNSASVTIPEGFYCPKVIDNTLWLSGGYGNEQFEVTQDGTTVSVARIDRKIDSSNGQVGPPPKGWGMNLKFHCCKNNDPCSYSYKYKKFCGDACTAEDHGNKLVKEINASVHECEKYCDKTKGCKSFTYCPGGSLCYVYDKTLVKGMKLKSRPDQCTSYHRTCEPISRYDRYDDRWNRYRYYLEK